MKYGKFESGKNSKPEGSAKAPKEKLSFEKNLLLYLHDFVYLIAAVLLIFLLCFRIIVVSGSSMVDTLVDGDYLLLLNSVFYSEPERGDIVVVSKDSFDDGDPIVKRIIALEGQTVDIDFQAGIVYVDGTALEEPYTYTLTTVQEGVSFPLVVEEGCVFVMGDNRQVSKDSRSPEIGLIDEREIMGKAIFLMLPGQEPKYGIERDYSRIGVIN